MEAPGGAREPGEAWGFSPSPPLLCRTMLWKAVNPLQGVCMRAGRGRDRAPSSDTRVGRRPWRWAEPRLSPPLASPPLRSSRNRGCTAAIGYPGKRPRRGAGLGGTGPLELLRSSGRGDRLEGRARPRRGPVLGHERVSETPPSPGGGRGALALPGLLPFPSFEIFSSSKRKLFPARMYGGASPGGWAGRRVREGSHNTDRSVRRAR